MKVLISPHRVVFLCIQKCGIESLLYLVGKEHGLIRDYEDIWSNRVCYGLIKHINIESLNNANIQVIAIKRNPYKRLVSGYISKILTNNYFGLPICRQMKNAYKAPDDRRITFREFVLFIIKQNKYTLDDHFQPQSITINKNIKNLKVFDIITDSSELQNTLKEFNFENSFENYNADHIGTVIRRDIPHACDFHYNDFDIAEKRSTNVFLKSNNKVVHSGVEFDGCTLPFYSNFYDDELKDLVYEYYKDDFIQLEYSKDSI